MIWQILLMLHYIIIEWIVWGIYISYVSYILKDTVYFTHLSENFLISFFYYHFWMFMLWQLVMLLTIDYCFNLFLGHLTQTIMWHIVISLYLSSNKLIFFSGITNINEPWMNLQIQIICLCIQILCERSTKLLCLNGAKMPQ